MARKPRLLSNDAMSVLMLLSCDGEAVIRELAEDAFGDGHNANVRRVRLALAEIGKWCGGTIRLQGTGISCSNGLHHTKHKHARSGFKHRYGLRRVDYCRALLLERSHKT